MEANNMAMREALETMSNLFEQGVICTSYINSAEEMEQIEELYRKVKAALASPPRNCDVGTAEEQEERFMRYCDSKVCNRRDCACGYEELFRHKCAIKWAQMTYEEGGGNDG